MKNYEKYIDHTILSATAQEKDIINLCSQALKHQFFSVCINPCYVKLCKELLKNSNVKICTVIGFPLGQNTTETKVFETKNAIDNGADEIDMVINVAKLIDNDEKYCLNEINLIKKACNDKTLKVIVETCYLNEEQKTKVAEIVLKSNADFIKTSTGFGTDGAKICDIKLFKEILKNNKKIKASGGIKTIDDIIEFINAGSDRIGTSKAHLIFANK